MPKENDSMVISKRLVIIISSIVALVLIACGIMMIEFFKARNLVDDEGYHDENHEFVISVDAFENMTETYQVQRYATAYLNADAEEFLYYVFGAADDVFVYNEIYEGEIITETTNTWTCESDYTKYLFHMEYGELYFERGDISEDRRPGVSDDGADLLIRDVLQMHGLKEENMTFGGSAAGLFTLEKQGTYYYRLSPVNGMDISIYAAGVYAVVGDGDLLALSYRNIEDDIVPIGQPAQTISAKDASQKLFELEMEEFHFDEDLIFTRAELVYDLARVYDNTDKAALVPVWEFSTADNIYFQVDAVTGMVFSGMNENACKIEQWNGEW